MYKNKRIALVAHDNKKKDLVEWVEYNWFRLSKHQITCTGTTGKLVEEAIRKKISVLSESEKAHFRSLDLKIERLKSGPLGGDQQLGAYIAEGKIDIVIFFWDPMEPQPHDVDVKALLRIAAVYNIPMACNRSSADFIISSELFEREYEGQEPDFNSYLNRKIPGKA